MADKSKIQWTEATWNPVVGCSLKSPGCSNCYAMADAARLEAIGQDKYRGVIQWVKGRPVWSGLVRLDHASLRKPMEWAKPRTVFVNSMSDLFHEALPDRAIDDVFAVMIVADRHTYQVLTKREGRLRAYMNAPGRLAAIRHRAEALFGKIRADLAKWHWPPPNVWLGVSAENQEWADKRIDELLGTIAAHRFVSFEPLLERIVPRPHWFGVRGTTDDTLGVGPREVVVSQIRVDLAILGGESSRKNDEARRCEAEWIADMIRDLQHPPQWGHAPAVFVKQLGTEATLHGKPMGLEHRKGGDMAEWPLSLRVRENPSRA